MRTIVALVGATATGKTDLAEALAGAIGGDVVCADSRQVFRELEIGTGKPTPVQRAARPHHLFDALSLGAHASAGWYARAAGETCEALLARGTTPVLVGGSGLYLRALMHGLHAQPPRDEAIRDRLQAELAERGSEAMHARLALVDAETAGRVHPGDPQRVLRALEVFESSGRAQSSWHARATREGLAADWRVLELTSLPRELSIRIERRTHAMFETGLIEETRALLAAGHREPLEALHAIGYDEAMAVLAGTLDRAAAEERTSQRTRQLAKRQRTWFRHQVEAARLASDGRDAAELLVGARGLLGL